MDSVFWYLAGRFRLDERFCRALERVTPAWLAIVLIGAVSGLIVAMLLWLFVASLPLAPILLLSLGTGAGAIVGTIAAALRMLAVRRRKTTK